MRRLILVLLAIGVAASGCLGPTDETGRASDPPKAPTEGAPGLTFADPVNVSKRFPGAEPVVEVGPDGTVYLQGVGRTEDLADEAEDLVLPPTVNRVWRSTDRGRTWTDVTPPLTGGNASCDGFVAVDGDGTVYASNCYMQAFAGVTSSTTLELYRSQDRGGTWERLPIPPFPEPMHRTWLVPDGDDTINLAVEALFPHGGLYHLRSTDDGTTWQGPTLVDPGTFFGSDLAVGPEGTQYAARMQGEFEADTYRYTGPWTMRVSTDDGLTWTEHEMFGLEGELATSWQALTVDRDGTVYMVWTETIGGTAHLRYAFSTDQGRTWEGPRSIGDANATRTMAWAEATAPGDLVVTWYEAQARGAPGEVNATWHGTAGVLTGADTAAPNLSTVSAVPWAVHEGAICTAGPFCEDDRELLDYTWVDVGPDGHAHAAFASTMWDAPSAFPIHVAER